MTGYQSKKKAAQDKLAQPEQEFNRTWVCNECGSQQFTSAICEADLDYLACSNCGGNEFHKEALAQPEQEPKSVTYKEVQDSMNALEKGNLRQQVIAEELGQRKLYTAPPPQPAQEQEPVGKVTEVADNGFKCEFNQRLTAGTKLYTTPPQRPWVGLTAEQAAECWTTSATQTWKNFEAKLKEKNNG